MMAVSTLSLGSVRVRWLAVLGACFCMLCSQPPVAMYTFGIFVPEIASATRWSLQVIASAIGPGMLIASLVSPPLGWVCDRFGTRAIALLGGPIFGLGLITLGLVPQSATAFVVFTAAMWFMSFAGSPVPYALMITGLINERRGLALSLMFASGALGIAVWPPYAAWLIRLFGWRGAYVGCGVTAGSIIFGSALFLLRSAPRTSFATPAEGHTLLKAMRTTCFWKIAVIFMLLTGVLGGAAVNLPVILRRQGLGAEAASLAITVVGLSMLVGRIALGPLLDRWFSPRVTIGCVLLSMAGFALLIWSGSATVIFVSASLLGLGLGADFNASAYIVGRAFGFRAFGAIYGFVTLSYGLGGAIGPATIGVSLARMLPQQIIFTVCLGLLVLAALLLATIRRSDLPY
jgi:MFS family permease